MVAHPLINTRCVKDMAARQRAGQMTVGQVVKANAALDLAVNLVSERCTLKPGV